MMIVFYTGVGHKNTYICWKQLQSTIHLLEIKDLSPRLQEPAKIPFVPVTRHQGKPCLYMTKSRLQLQDFMQPEKISKLVLASMLGFDPPQQGQPLSTK